MCLFDRETSKDRVSGVLFIDGGAVLGRYLLDKVLPAPTVHSLEVTGLYPVGVSGQRGNN